MSSLKDDEVYCLVTPKGRLRTWSIGRTKYEVKQKNEQLYLYWKDLKKEGWTIKKFKLIKVK
jgi:hypothetical protein